MIVFTSTKCNPCSNLKAWLADQPESITNNLVHIDIDDNKDAARDAGVTTIPALLTNHGELISTNERIRPFLLSLDTNIKTVVKRDGSIDVFDADKLNKWAQYATKTGGNWSEIAIQTFKRLNPNTSTTDIHQTMINVCLDREQLEYSRVASRLEYAVLRKNMSVELNISDKDDFEVIFNAMIANGVWCENTLPSYNPIWNEWYQEITETYLEYWQIRQWVDKYSRRINDQAIETPHMAALAIGLAIHGDTNVAFELALSIVKGKINLPTPVINGCRNGDFNGISCCVIKGGDTIDSIGVAEHISYKMTAKKAGIGITFETRSKGADVKGGSIKHLGKHGIYQTVDRAIKMFTQISRGGSATMTYACIDPQIEELILWKTQRVDIEERIDKMDYSFAYNDAFVDAVVKNTDWQLWDFSVAPLIHEAFYTASVEDYNELVREYVKAGVNHTSMNARELLKMFLTARQETGRVYCVNVTRMNTHTPFYDTIYQSNLCQEIALPTKQYDDMFDLYAKPSSNGETAFCSLAAINVTKVETAEYEEIAELALRTVDVMIDKVPMMTPSMEESVRRRRSIGVGITGLAGYLYQNNMDFDGTEQSLGLTSELSEIHYYYLLKASQKLSSECGFEIDASDINYDWLPIDTMVTKGYETKLDWESLRGIARKHSVMVAHMPTESSAVFSDATNGLYPVRRRVINKGSRRGVVQYIAPEGDYKLAWDIPNNTLSKYYSRVQDFTDQGISADYYVDFTKFSDGKVPLSQLFKEWIVQAKLGNKSMYYQNFNDDNGGSIQDVLAKPVEEEGCDSCKL